MKKSTATSGPKASLTVESYFARVPEPARAMLSALQQAIRSAAPRGTTEIISYRMPAFKHHRVLVWYAAFRDHCSLFPGGSVLQGFKDETSRFKTSKGTIQFPLDEPLPVRLIKKIVKARVAEVAAKPRP